jgi:hypothetical protein
MSRTGKWIAAAVVGLMMGSASAAAQDSTAAQQEFARGLAAMARGELAEAQRRFEKVVEIDPDSFEAHNNLAVIYTEQGNFDAALAEMKKVMEMQPDYYRGRKNLAELYARLAHRSFLEAADVAPPGEREQLATRARLMGAPGGGGERGGIAGGTLEPAKAGEEVARAPAAAAPTAAPQAPPPAAAAPATAAVIDTSPSALVMLPEGVAAVVVSDAGIRLFRRVGEEPRPAERIAVKRPGALPPATALYVAVPTSGRVDLVALHGGEKPFSLRSSGGGERDFLVAAEPLATLVANVQPYLTPVVAGSDPAPRDHLPAEATSAAVLAALHGWVKHWQGKNLAGYLESYAADYNPRGGPGHDKWRQQRARVFERSGDITVTLSDPVLLQHGDDIIALTRQEYRSKLQSSIGVKKLDWVLTINGWKIVGEEMLSEKKL